jgi:hypothetical protein
VCAFSLAYPERDAHGPFLFSFVAYGPANFSTFSDKRRDYRKMFLNIKYVF